MLTFTDQVNMCKSISNLSDATSTIEFKRDINAGTARFLAKLGRPVDQIRRYTSLVASQQYYQLPEDVIRIVKAIALSGTSTWEPLEEIASEEDWNNLNRNVQTGSYPQSFFIRDDEIGLYPIPSAAVTDGLLITFEPRHVLLTADDYSIGTVFVTNGSATITGNATVFTPVMANGTYVLEVTDGTDGIYYKISGYSSGTSLTLENYYQGSTSSTATYRIGQVSKIPEEYQEAPVDYAMYRHFLSKGQKDNAATHKKIWEDSLEDAQETYSMNTGNQVIQASGSAKTYNPMTSITSNQIRT